MIIEYSLDQQKAIMARVNRYLGEDARGTVEDFESDIMCSALISMPLLTVGMAMMSIEGDDNILGTNSVLFYITLDDVTINITELSKMFDHLKNCDVDDSFHQLFYDRYTSIQAALDHVAPYEAFEDFQKRWAKLGKPILFDPVTMRKPNC